MRIRGSKIIFNFDFVLNVAFFNNMAQDLKLAVVIAKCTFICIENQILDVGCRTADATKDS